MPAPYVTGDEPDLNETLETAKTLDRHLSEAIRDFGPPKGPIMSKGLRRLKNLSESLMASVDAEADKAADELQKVHDEAVDTVRGVRDHIGGEFRNAASDLKDMLNQITNGDPNG